MLPLSEGRYPAVPEVSLEASPRPPSFSRSGVDVNVVNNSLFPLICRFEAKSVTKSIPLDPEFVWVDAQTTATLALNVALAFPPANSVVVRAYHVGALIERIVRVRAPFAAYTPLLPLLVVLLALAAIPVYRAAHVPPKVLALTAPPRVFVGDRVDVQYDTSGAQATAYDVQRDRRTVAHGALTGASGGFGFVAASPGTYTIDLRASNANGVQDATQGVTAQPTAKPQVATLISALSVNPPVADAGSTVVVSYATRAQKGSVRLLDESGVTWAAAPWNNHGSTALKAPQVTANRRFTVELDVSAGSLGADARTGLLVVPPSPAANAVPAPHRPAATEPPRVSSGTPAVAQNGMPRVTTEPEYVVSGEYFRVDPGPQLQNAVTRVTLQAADGSPIASHTPQDGLMFVAPVVSSVERYYLVLTLAHNKSGGLIVQPFDVHPH